MGHLIYIALIFFFFSNQLSHANIHNKTKEPKDSLNLKLNELTKEVNYILRVNDHKLSLIYKKIAEANDALMSNSATDLKLKFLLKKDSLKEAARNVKLHARSDISKVRYIKGIEIIKLLYNKTLALDHHFSSVTTLNEINKMANPNQYASFTDVKKVIKSKRDKRTGFDLTKILGDNIYTSITHSLVSLFTNTNTQQPEKEAVLKEIECVIDFTLRMSNDLDTIYFETVFLQKNNETIMTQLDELFLDFTKPIGYSKSLKICRNTDDWDRLSGYLNNYIIKMDKELANQNNQSLAQKMQINLEFPIDQLLQFIIQYNAFIDQGGKFYEKFGIMLNSYENEEQCGKQIPSEYHALKQAVDVAIEKFNTAYKPVEINGSKLKQLLYGISEYD